jgi:hypothetical protein
MSERWRPRKRRRKGAVRQEQSGRAKKHNVFHFICSKVASPCIREAPESAMEEIFTWKIKRLWDHARCSIAGDGLKPIGLQLPAMPLQAAAASPKCVVDHVFRL